MTLHHLLLEFTSILNVFVMVIYWSLVHEVEMKDPIFINNKYKRWHMYVVHIIPALFFVINVAISDVLLIKKHVLLYLIPGVLYAYVNYLATLKAGKPLYFFIDWINDFDGAIKITVGLNAAVIFVFVGTALVI